MIEAKRFDQKRSCLEQDRFGWNCLASIATWRPKRESCSIPYIVEQDSRSMIEAKRFDQKRSCSRTRAIDNDRPAV
jgi:hypothetical protein